MGSRGSWGRVPGLPHLGEELIREEQKQCGQVTVKDLNKEEPRTFLRLSSEALNPKDKGYQEGKWELGGSRLDRIMFEGPGREAVLRHFSVTGGQWVRELPPVRNPHVPQAYQTTCSPLCFECFLLLVHPRAHIKHCLTLWVNPILPLNLTQTSDMLLSLCILNIYLPGWSSALSTKQ